MPSLCIVEGTEEFRNIDTLRVWRLKKHLTTRQLGNAAGVSSGLISRIERCPQTCTVQTYNLLAAYMGWGNCKAWRVVPNISALLYEVKGEEKVFPLPDSVPQDAQEQCVNEQLSLPGTISRSEFTEFVRLMNKFLSGLEGWVCVD